MVDKYNVQKQAFNGIKNRALWDKESKYCLSCCLRNGFGCDRDIKTGIEILHQLALKGYSKAQYLLGHCIHLFQSIILIGIGLKRIGTIA